MSKEVLDKMKEKPFKVLAIVFILLFWMLTPLVAQKYFNYSAITVSFVITVAYYVLWKLYNEINKDR